MSESSPSTEPPVGPPPSRLGGALGTSVFFHALLLSGALALAPRPTPREPPVPPTPTRVIDAQRLVNVALAGPGERKGGRPEPAALAPTAQPEPPPTPTPPARRRARPRMPPRPAPTLATPEPSAAPAAPASPAEPAEPAQAAVGPALAGSSGGTTLAASGGGGGPGSGSGGGGTAHLGRGSGEGPGANGDEGRAWLASVRARIDAAKRYPMIARRMRQEGTVILRLHVRADGRLGEVRVRGDAPPALRDAALAAVAEAAPFPRPPEGTGEVSIEVPLVFSLARDGG